MRVIRGVALAVVVVGLATSAARAEARAADSPAAASSVRATALAATVVWAEPGLAYVVARDSGAVAPGMRLTLLDRRRVVATGRIASVLEGRFASVRLAGGSLERKRLERLRVEIEPLAEPRLAVMRVGVPAGARENLVLPCREPSLALDSLAARYRFESPGEGAARGVRLSDAADLPDTLLIRSFGDAADEQIALERGELDVAVFWPGEPSARARAGARGGEWLAGRRSRGALALDLGGPAGGVAAAAAREPRLRALNDELLGGDLIAIAAPDSAPTAAGEPAPADLLPASRGFAVDGSLPGQRAIEHFLNGGATLFVRDKLGPVRLRFMDVPDAAGPTSGSVPVFALRCPILCAPGMARHVRVLGPGTLADLVRCAPPERRP